MHTVSSITEGVQDMAVFIREQVNFFCSAMGAEVGHIWWTVDCIVYESCPAEEHSHICFENSYMNDTATTLSTLIITDSSSLGVGNHTVQ